MSQSAWAAQIDAPEDLLTTGEGKPSEQMAEESKDVRNRRADFLWNAYMGFQEPMIVRGTNKVLFPHPTNRTENHPSVQAVIDEYKQVESQFALATVRDITEYQIVTTYNGYLLLAADDADLPNLAIELLSSSEGSNLKPTLGLRTYCGLIGVPANFAAKSPAIVNDFNFNHYHQERLAEVSGESKKPKPLEILYVKTPIKFDLSNIDLHNDFLFEEDLFEAFAVVNIYAKQGTQTGDWVDTANSTPVAARVPMVSMMLEGLINAVHRFNPDQEMIIQRHSSGFSPEVADHTFEIQLPQTPPLKINGDSFAPTIYLRSNFSGDKSFGNTQIGFMITRLICTNGMVIGASEETRRQAIEEFKAMAVAGGLEITDDEEQLEALAYAVFSPTGQMVSNGMANTGTAFNDLVGLYLSFLKHAPMFFEQRLAALDADLEKFDSEEFVAIVHGIQKDLKLASPQLMRFFLIEYASGVLSGRPSFTTPLDVLNYLTFIAQAFDPLIRMDMQLKAYEFAARIQQAAMQGVTKKALFDHYAGQVKDDLLVKEVEVA